MGSTTSAGTALAISAGTPATPDATGFAALTYTEIGQIDQLGAIGKVFNKVEFQPLKGSKQKHKGSSDNGALAPSVALDDADAGQTLLRTAANDATSKLYAFKVTYPTGAIRYFQGRVFGFPENTGNADSIIMGNPTIEIDTTPIPVAAP